MKITLGRMSLFAAAVGLVGALWIASPAKAGEFDALGKQTAASVRAAFASAKRHHHHHAWSRYRVASWYTSHLRYADLIPAGYWSPRPVLLMVGVAY